VGAAADQLVDVRWKRFVATSEEACCLRPPTTGIASSPGRLTGQRAAKVLDVSVAQLNILAGQGLLPFETHADGTRLYRRQQLEVVARARAAQLYRFSGTATASE